MYNVKDKRQATEPLMTGRKSKKLLVIYNHNKRSVGGIVGKPVKKMVANAVAEKFVNELNVTDTFEGFININMTTVALNTF